jgi:chromosome segregation ATPase
MAAVEQVAQILGRDAVIGQVGDFLSPEPGRAALLDRVWHDWLELPVIRADRLDPDQLAAVAELEARIRLVVATDAPPPEPRPGPVGCERLLDQAGVSVSLLPWLARTLPPAYLCPDAEWARRLAEAHPDVIVVGPDQVVWRGRVMEPPTAGSRLRGALELRDHRHALQSEIAQAADQVESAAVHRRATDASLAEVEEALRSLDAELLRAEQERARATAVEQSLLEDRSRLERELEALEAEMTRSHALRGELKQRRARLEGEVEAVAARNLELERQLEGAAATVDSHRNAAAEALRRLDRWQA